MTETPVTHTDIHRHAYVCEQLVLGCALKNKCDEIKELNIG